jgi:dihydrofolate reductase
MRKIVVVENLTLDGVMQAPNRPDEDERDGFGHGGWALSYNDPIKGRAMAQGMGGEAGPLLFGRRTYEDFYRVWPKRTGNPFTEVLDNAQKYVASTTLSEPLPWKNSTLLSGNAIEAIARLKEQPGKDIVVLGSGELVGSLRLHNLVDEYMLSIHPLILGSGRRLFTGDDSRAPLTLVTAVTTTTGVVMATYRAGAPTL